MSRTLLTLASRLAIAAVLAGLAWWHSGGPSSLFVIALALSGPLLARPLVDLAGDLRRGLRQAVWAPLEGQHFVFRGVPVVVHEDVDHRRWIRLADLQRIAGFTASDGALALTYPQHWHVDTGDGSAWLEAEAAIVHLRRDPGARALRLAQWIDREVAYPARRQRERLGIRVPPPKG